MQLFTQYKGIHMQVGKQANAITGCAARHSLPVLRGISGFYWLPIFSFVFDDSEKDGMFGSRVV